MTTKTKTKTNKTTKRNKTDKALAELAKMEKAKKADSGEKLPMPTKAKQGKVVKMAKLPKKLENVLRSVAIAQQDAEKAIQSTASYMREAVIAMKGMTSIGEPEYTSIKIALIADGVLPSSAKAIASTICKTAKGLQKAGLPFSVTGLSRLAEAAGKRRDATVNTVSKALKADGSVKPVQPGSGGSSKTPKAKAEAMTAKDKAIVDNVVKGTSAAALKAIVALYDRLTVEDRAMLGKVLARKRGGTLS